MLSMEIERKIVVGAGLRKELMWWALLGMNVVKAFFSILIIIFDFSVVIVSFTYSLKMNSRYLLHYIRYLVRTRR